MKSLYNYIVLSCFIISLSDTFYAQGKFLEKGKSGFGVSTSIAFSKISSGYGGAFGYSYSGILDLSLAVGRSFPDGSLTSEVYANFIAPQLAIFLRKQENKDHGPSISLSLSYQFIEVKQPNTFFLYYQGSPYGVMKTEGTRTTKADAGSISLSFSRNMREDLDPIVQLDLSLGMSRSKDVNQFCILFGIPIGTYLNQNTILAFTPTVGVIIIERQKFIAGGLGGSIIF